MADINKPPPVPPVGWQKERPRGGPGTRGRAFARAVAAYGSGPAVPAAADDVSSLHGIPDRDLTPPVRAALEDLMAEIERLRWAVEQSEGRQAYLEGLADRDSLLPVLNRRAFERELTLLLQKAGSGDADPAAPEPVAGAMLALFYLTNVEALHVDYGLSAAESALRHMAEALLQHVRQSDVVGALGCGGIGVVLTLTDPAAARSKVEELRRAVLAWPPRQGGADLPLEVACGLAPLAGGLTVASALAQADRLLWAPAATDTAAAAPATPPPEDREPA